jgi:hypothetical protein
VNDELLEPFGSENEVQGERDNHDEDREPSENHAEFICSLHLLLLEGLA